MMEPPIDDTNKQDYWLEFIFKEISTPDLIAELERRRPCAMVMAIAPLEWPWEDK